MTAPTRLRGTDRPAGLRRSATVTAVLVALGVLALVVTLGSGPLPVNPIGVVRAIAGTADGGATFAVMQVGLPRILTAWFVGLALGAAGSLVQALTANPLGSPDVIGFDAGAATGALVGILVLGLPPLGYSALAVLVGLAVAAGVYLLAGRRDTGYRIVLVGIGVGACFDAVNAWLLTRSDATESLDATRWLIGSLSQSTWRTVEVAMIGVLVLLPLAAVLARHLRMLLMGTETATALGVPVGRVTAATLALSVALSALAVLVAGPISFVALAAPQLANRLCGGRRLPYVVASAAMGGLLLVVSDLLGQRAVPGTPVPVGIVTGVVGGGYLAWLLAHEWRRRSR